MGWTYNQTYSLMSQEGAKVPVWYVMDEHGCALTHGGPEANFQCSPFFNVQTGATFNLLWPVKNVAAGGMCTRNFIPHIMPQESATISKTRLKAFSGRKIYTKAMKEEKEEEDIVVPEQQTGGGGCCVVFGVDVLVDSTLAPLVVDVNGVCNPPTKKALQDILRLLAGQPSEAFVQVK